jgi:putative transposase
MYIVYGSKNFGVGKGIIFQKGDCMKIISSYAIEIKHINKLFRQTIKIYHDAISFCVKVLEEHWDVLSTLETGNKERFAYADALIHSTKSNHAIYPEFDIKFYKMPSYLRFAVINTALGYLSSYHSNLDNWEYSISNSKAPSLQTHLNKLPTFYKGNMYLDDCEGDAVRLKLFVNNDWNWVEVQLKHTDVVSIQRHMKNAKMSVPTLEKKNKKYFLRFAFEEKVELNKTPLKQQRILAVDLGINTDAICSVMNLDGAILAREFVNFASDKDQLYHTLNKIKKAQQKYGFHNVSKLWRYAKFHNEELARKIAKEITSIAVKHQCDVIVFEHLDMKGKKHGSKKQKLQMWKKNTIQRIVEHKAHQNSIRISHICAWCTSKLAFDGSGKVLRGKDANLDTYELCKFSNGKIYNCDLSASYNIGARYFIREIQKILPGMVWSDIVAKVPECQKRTQCTYATLLEINKAA